MNTPKPLVLIVEDDESIRELLDFMFQREGYDTLLVADGRATTGLIASGRVPVLAVLDIMLPYADGFEVLAEMRKNEGWRDVPVIMLTARSAEPDIVKGLDSGVADYVLKPFQPQELMARARRLLRAG